MPSVLRIGSLRFFFYASDRDEPLHMHVEQARNVAKFWLEPVRLARNAGFNSSELNRIQGLIEENLEDLRKSWDDFFTT